MKVSTLMTHVLLGLTCVALSNCRTAADESKALESGLVAGGPALQSNVVDETSKVVAFGTDAVIDMLHFDRITLLVAGASVGNAIVEISAQALATCTLEATSDGSSWMNVKVGFVPTLQEDGPNGCSVIVSRNGVATKFRLTHTSIFTQNHGLACKVRVGSTTQTWPNIGIGVGSVQSSSASFVFPPQQARRILNYDKLTRNAEPFTMELAIEAKLDVRQTHNLGIVDIRYSFIDPTSMETVDTAFRHDDPTLGIAGRETIRVVSDNSIHGFLSWSLALRLPEGFQFQGQSVNVVETICSAGNFATDGHDL